MSPPHDVDRLFECYEDYLRGLVDKYAPLETKTIRRCIIEPWYNHECWCVKKETRRLEKLYRHLHTSDTHRQWRRQFTVQRSIMQRAYSSYWSRVINGCTDTRTLWRKLGTILQPIATSVDAHSAEDFCVFLSE